MAKACAYLCRQCCFIDGFGEFGEFLRHISSHQMSIFNGRLTNILKNSTLTTKVKLEVILANATGFSFV